MEANRCARPSREPPAVEGDRAETRRPTARRRSDEGVAELHGEGRKSSAGAARVGFGRAPKKSPATRGFFRWRWTNAQSFSPAMKLSKRILGEAEPQHLVALEVAHVGVDLLPLRALACRSRRRPPCEALNEASITACGKGSSLVLAATSCLSALGLQRVVLGQHVAWRHGGGGFDDGLVLRRQRVERLLVDEEVHLGAAFPPAGVVVERRDLVEAQLLVVVGADPLGRVDACPFRAPGRSRRPGCSAARRPSWSSPRRPGRRPGASSGP